MSTKRTYQPSKIKRQRMCGFRARMAKNPDIIAARRRKGRARLAV